MNLSKKVTTPTLVECSECHFSRVVTPDDGELPADIVIEHGKETGHTLSTGPVDEGILAERQTK